jgi:hypothetical protein
LVSPKRRFLQKPLGVMFQKMTFFIVTAVKISNLTQFSSMRKRTTAYDSSHCIPSQRVRLLFTANIVPSSPIHFTMMEATLSSETSVLTGATRRHFPEYGILHSYRSHKLKSSIALTD